MMSNKNKQVARIAIHDTGIILSAMIGILTLANSFYTFILLLFLILLINVTIYSLYFIYLACTKRGGKHISLHHSKD